jgi:Protein of unknown function with HXXEE motif
MRIFPGQLPHFRQLVWLGPVVFLIHVLDELRGLTPWVRRHINPFFTHRHYRAVHLSGIAAGVLAAALVSRFPSRPILLLYFSFLATPTFLWNIFFHAGTSAIYQTPSPGLLSALLLYPPFYALLARAAVSEGLLSFTQWLVSALAAAAFHAVEVRANVYRFGRPAAIARENA